MGQRNGKKAWTRQAGEVDARIKKECTIEHRILFIYPDRLFNDFIKNFLELKGYIVKTSADSVEGIRVAINFMPDLIILNKEFDSLDARGFVIKKRTLHAIDPLSLFLIGDFSPEELVEFKKEKVKAFLSAPLNPTALLERLNIFFDRKDLQDASRTPRLMDIQVRYNIIVVQIEGNFEAVKLELMNYLIRNFCIQKKIKTPKIFLIVPNLYPESITLDNLGHLFRFMEYHEIQMDYRFVKVLTGVSKLIELLKKHAEFQNFELVSSYADGMQSLQIDFDKQKSIPVDFLKADSTYVFDLFDEQGRKLIPAMTRLTEKTIKYLKEKEIAKLTYYSDKDMDELLNTGQEDLGDEPLELLDNEILMDLIAGEYEPIESEIGTLKILDQKHSLFFRKMKGQHVLIISPEDDFIAVIQNALDIYFDIEFMEAGTKILEQMAEQRYAIIFVDSNIQQPDALEVLQTIRTEATRRKTSVIILTRKIDKASVIRYRNCGTQNILLSPFSTSRIQQAVFDSVTSDRRT